MSETRYIISDAAKMIDVEPHVLRYWEEELGMEIPRNEMGHRYYTEKEVRLFTMVRDLKEKGFQLKAIKMVLSALSEETSGGLRSDGDHETNETREDRKGIISFADVRKNYDSDQNMQAKKNTEVEKNVQIKKNMENFGQMKSNGETDAQAQRSGENRRFDDENGVRTMHGDADVAEGKNDKKIEDRGTQDKLLPAEDGVKTPVMVTAEDKMKHFKYMMDGIMMQALKRNNQTLEAELVDHISDKVIKEMDYLFRVQEEKEEERYRNIDELIRKKQKGRKEAAAAKAPAYGPKKSKRRLF